MSAEHPFGVNPPSQCSRPESIILCAVLSCFSVGAFLHSANYYVVHPGNTPANHPPPLRLPAVENRDFSHSARTAHGAPPTPICLPRRPCNTPHFRVQEANTGA